MLQLIRRGKQEQENQNSVHGKLRRDRDTERENQGIKHRYGEGAYDAKTDVFIKLNKIHITKITALSPSFDRKVKIVLGTFLL
jgi:hypothetical protein